LAIGERWLCFLNRYSLEIILKTIQAKKRWRIGGVVSCVAPTEVPFANVSSVAGDISDTRIEITTLGDTTGCIMLVFATPSLSQGTKFVKNKLRVVGYYTGGDAELLNVWGDYVAKYGAPAVGANLYVGVRVINANGQASPLETLKATISA
jgi:hypothetical protein